MLIVLYGDIDYEKYLKYSSEEYLNKYDKKVTTMVEKEIKFVSEITFFNCEIKTRNCNIEDCEGLPLTVNKYCNLKDDTKQWERLIYISLVNDDEYFIYDLDKVNWNKVICRHWYINDIEYTKENQIKKKIPTFFFPISESCYNGFIN